MIGPVDVLAVLDRLEDYYRRHEVLIGPVDDAYSVEHKAARLAVAELIESARALRSAHRAFQDWKAQAPKVYPAPRSILEMNAGAKARLFAALDRVGGAK